MDPFIGEIRIFGFNYAPAGWATCSGQLLPISSNTALFSLLGTAFGGDGVRTFALPDLRGRAPMNQGSGPGLTPRVIGEASGGETVTLLNGQIPQHQHGVSASQASDATNPSGAFPSNDSRAPLSIYATAGDGTAMNPQTTRIAGGNLPHNNLEPYLAGNFCISLQGIYPSRS